MTNWHKLAEDNKEEIMEEILAAWTSVRRDIAGNRSVEVHLFPDGQLHTTGHHADHIKRGDMWSVMIWADDAGMRETNRHDLWQEVRRNIDTIEPDRTGEWTCAICDEDVSEYPVGGLDLNENEILNQLCFFYAEAYEMKMAGDMILYADKGDFAWGPGCNKYPGALMSIFMPHFYDYEGFEEELLALGGRDEDGQIDDETAKKAWAAVLAAHQERGDDKVWAENIFRQMESY